MDYRNLAEEELKLRIAEQFFPTYDCAHRIGKIDVAVTLPNPQPTTHNPQPTTHNPQPRARCNNVAIPPLGRSQARDRERYL